MKTIRFFRLSYFIWILIPVVVWLVMMIYGLPHLRWSYSWRDDGQGYDPHAIRYYTRCTYVSINNRFTVHPMNGECSFIRFQKKAGSDS